MARDAASVEDEEDQKNLFPELDNDNKEHQAVMRQAKKFAKAKASRDEVLSTAKAEVDASEKKLLEMMHAEKIEKFKHNGMKVNIIPKGEKVRVKLDDDEDKEGDGNE